ncbi:tumor necrosis factor receptor superfamily member 14-like isoform X2 [Hippocampus comes]|uniref:tumor necrosis factor receptor superfamily member 14-like isoform X2 n=1 Tax=Hippocampus comes TaxID=109280 RepID=UPI00094ECC6A|nr:PREDICTED: tumor necrosis factor receptor superfamily member 14-like isoform X2 [Hippocampus comes]
MVLGNKHLARHHVLLILTYVVRGHTLQCHQTEYQLNENLCCPKCPIGSQVRSDCTKRGSTSCQLCLNGTYMNIPTGLKNCLPCTNCNAGSGLAIKKACTRESDAVCKPLDGFFCVDQVGDGCLEARNHTDCRPGQYISQQGTPFTDTICKDCIGGTFSNGTFCQPHTKCESEHLLIKRGTASTDAECGQKKFPVWIIVIAIWSFCVFVAVLICFIRNWKVKYEIGLNWAGFFFFFVLRQFLQCEAVYCCLATSFGLLFAVY